MILHCETEDAIKISVQERNTTKLNRILADYKKNCEAMLRSFFYV